MGLNKALQQRLDRLIAKKRTAFVPPPPPALGLYIVALFGGHFSESQSPLESYALAIAGLKKGEERAEAVKRFRKMAPAEITARHAEVLARILRRKGADTDLEKFNRLMKALDRSGLVPAVAWGAKAAA
jgi:hypothetical protein